MTLFCQIRIELVEDQERDALWMDITFMLSMTF